jgi:hypothetical protein
MSETMSMLAPRWRKFLQNPVWYVAVVAALAVATSYLPFLWWFAGVVALIWGAWLLRQLFGENAGETTTDGQVPLDTYMEQTLAYKTQIDRLIKTTPGSPNHAHLEQLAVQLDTCTKAIKEMVQRLAGLRQDDLIRYDLAAVPEAIAGLETRLANEANSAIVTPLKHVLAARQNQLALLEHLQTTIIQTELQLEHTLSVLGSIYSQILIGRSTNEMADYSRLSADIDEEMNRLADQLEALSEVKGEYAAIL